MDLKTGEAKREKVAGRNEMCEFRPSHTHLKLLVVLVTLGPRSATSLDTSRPDLRRSEAFWREGLFMVSWAEEERERGRENRGGKKG